MGVSSTHKVPTFGPFYTSRLKSSPSCPCSLSLVASSRPFSNSLHRLGVIVAVQGRDGSVKLVSRNYTTLPVFDASQSQHVGTRNSWQAEGERLRGIRRNEVKEEQPVSRSNGAHFFENKDRDVKFRFVNEQKRDGNSNVAISSENGQLASFSRIPNESSFSSVPEDSWRRNGQKSTVISNAVVGYENNWRMTAPKIPNGSSVSNISKGIPQRNEQMSKGNSNLAVEYGNSHHETDLKIQHGSSLTSSYKDRLWRIEQKSMVNGNVVVGDENSRRTTAPKILNGSSLTRISKDHRLASAPKIQNGSSLTSIYEDSLWINEQKWKGNSSMPLGCQATSTGVQNSSSVESISQDSLQRNEVMDNDSCNVVKVPVDDHKKLNGIPVKWGSKLGVQVTELPVEETVEYKKDAESDPDPIIGSRKNKKPVVRDNKKPSGVKVTSSSSDICSRLVSIYKNVLVVNNVSMAKKIVSKLTNQYRHLVHACDTEVASIDVKRETPVNHGEIICFSIYSGPEADFGDGKSCIWVDVLDGGGKNLLAEFASFFEDQSIKKVWHNYSFDNHVIENYGISLSGFHADTMHMARLWDSSRRTDGGYSLEALTSNHSIMKNVQSCYKELIGKVSMKNIFGKKKVKKDGSEGKITIIAPVEELQREEREPWICYSALDAVNTLQLYESLKCLLSQMPWELDGWLLQGKNMFDFYQEYWQPFGEILVRMEREGMLVDRPYLAEMEKVAKAEQEIASNRFRNWASKYCPDAQHMNVGSDTQLRQLLFGGIANRKDPSLTLPDSKEFKVPNVDEMIEEGKKTPSKYRTIKLNSVGVELQTEMYTATGWPSVSADALKILAGKVSAEYDFAFDSGKSEEDCYELEESLNLENVDTSAYGTALKAFPKNRLDEGIEACHAIASLIEVCSIDSLISNFIIPLQGTNVSGKTGRVHCSLNINTETGRLSARRPNLQNQPALEKDRYKIRRAFIAEPGNSLVVADYGQLELRILAHLADCKSMLEAFKAGGDFHSRTAMNMYPHIREAIEKKQVLLEWYPQPGEDKPPVPLLKDAFASERRKAKMLNFSIAYGKTPMGLAKDWKVSVEEARKTVNLWYNERKEVLKWQEARKQEANIDGCVHTLLGRARRFPAMALLSRSQRGHIERAAINTPVQGSAADVAMCAMLEISKNTRLKELGWRLLLQVHDEVILEGPTESAEVAKSIAVECMSKPFNGKNILKVDLSVDAKCAQNWYDAK